MQNLEALEPGYFKVLGDTIFETFVIDLKALAKAELEQLLQTLQ